MGRTAHVSVLKKLPLCVRENAVIKATDREAMECSSEIGECDAVRRDGSGGVFGKRPH